MKFNSFEFIAPCIDETKAFLKPLKFRDWLKMGFISFMSAGLGGGMSSRVSSPVRFPASVFRGGRSGSASGAAGSAVAATLSKLLYLLIPLGIVLFVLLVLWNYLTSVFSFVFVEALDTRKVLVRRPFARNKGLGLSLFLFRFVIMVIVLCMIAVAVVPIIMMIMAGKANPGAIVALVLSLLAYLLIFFVVMMVLAVFLSLVYNFSFLHMYFHRMRIWKSIRTTFPVIFRNVLEVIVFWLARLCIGIVVGIAGFLAFIVVILPALLILGPIGIALFFIGKALAWSIPVIVVIVLVAFAALVILGYVMNVLMLPFSVFGTYFSIRNYRALMKR